MKFSNAYLFMLFAYLCNSCMTISVSMVHTEGQASDVIDETQTQTPTSTVSPNLTIPTSILP